MSTPPSSSPGSRSTSPAERASAEFDGLVAAVTGGGSGIGLATATLLRERGARVACLDSHLSHLPDVSDASPMVGVRCDVTDAASVPAAIAEVVAHFGRIDVLVNNAGIGAQGTVADHDDEEWHRVLDVNVVGIARVTRAALPHLRASSSPAIVNTCSVAATAGLPRRALYGASKGAVRALTFAMAADHLAEGIRVNCVHPGTADTPWVDRLLNAAEDPQAERSALEARQPLGRLVSANEVANAIVSLASPQAASTTGAELAVDGGMQNLRMPPR